jgi:hypothetical protein
MIRMLHRAAIVRRSPVWTPASQGASKGHPPACPYRENGSMSAAISVPFDGERLERLRRVARHEPDAE